MGLRLVASACAIVLFLGVASTANAADPAIMGDGGTVRLMVNLAGDTSFPPYVIQKLALDRKHGFTMQVIPSNTVQSTTTGFQSGAGDIGMYGWNDLARIKAGGVNIVGIGPFLGWANTLVVPAGSPIHNVGDLKGKKVGVFNRTGLDWTVARAVAKAKYRLDLDTDIVMQAGAVPLLRGLMEQGQMDATQMFNDFTAPMVVSGKFRLLASTKDLVNQLGLPDTPVIVYTADTGYAAAHPANVKAFLAAYRDAIDALETDDNIWIEPAAALGMTDSATLVALRKQTRPMLIKRFAPDAEASIRKMWDILVATAGAETLGMSKLADGFMTLDYQ